MFIDEAKNCILSLINSGWQDVKFDIDYIANNNSKAKLNSTSKNSNAKIKYSCILCGKEEVLNKSTLVNRKPTDIGLCAACASKYKHKGKLLKDVHPELLEEWDYNENSEYDVSRIGSGSHYLAHWICKKDPSHKWVTSVGNRSKGTTCPYCLQIKNGSTNVLSSHLFKDRYPKLLKEWDYDKNDDKLLETLTFASHKKVWWRCEYGHSWQANIKNRTMKNSGCPKCSMRRSVSKIDLMINYYITKYFPDTIKEAHFLDRYWDNYIPSIKTIIEFDGGRWHNSHAKSDLNRIKIALSHGYELIKVLDSDNTVPKVDNIKVHYLTLKEYNDEQKEKIINDVLHFLGIRDNIDVNADREKLNKYITDFSKQYSLDYTYPDIAPYWSNKNPLSVDKTTMISDNADNIYLKCPKCKYEFTYRISNLGNNPKEICPMCRHINTWGKYFKYLYGDSKKLADDPYTSWSNIDYADFMCPTCGTIVHMHPYKTTIEGIEHFCPICTKRRESIRAEKLRKKWESTLTMEKNYYSPGLTEQPLSEINWKDGYNNLTWQCPDCKQVFSKTPNGLRRGKYKCPICGRKKDDKKFQELLEYVDEDLLNGVSKYTISLGDTQTKYSFKCPKCHQVFKCTPLALNRRPAGKKCPYCER